MPKEPVWERHAVVCPKDLGEPKELLTFIQLDAYTEAFIKLELTDDEQRSIEIGIMMNPTLPPVIEGTGGVREFQCSTPTQSNGSLHLSVFYVYFPESEAVALALVAHTDDCGIMTNEERAQIKLLIEEIQQDMGW